MNKEIDDLLKFVKSRMLTYNNSDRHAVFCGILTNEGNRYFAPNLDTYVGRAAVCAEPIALGQVINNNEKPKYIVSLYKTGSIVMPCGICRELLTDYCPDAYVVTNISGEISLIKVQELLPHKYQRK